MNKIWSAYDGRVVCVDFTQKPVKYYKQYKQGDKLINLLEHHEDGYKSDMMCVRCLWRGDMYLVGGYPLWGLSCPSCKCEGCLVRG